MIFLAIVIVYLIGSIPTAYIFGKLYKGIDIREHGSGNVGATNVFRVLGKVPGIIVLIIDILKGVVPVAVVADVMGFSSISYRILFAVVAVCGHNWTIFLNFKGGKGIATSLGVLIGLAIREAALRPVLGVTLGSWLVCFFAFGYVSLASMFAAVVLPIIIVVTSQPLPVVILGVVFCFFVIFRHRPNIQRLLKGEEPLARTPLFKRK